MNIALIKYIRISAFFFTWSFLFVGTILFIDFTSKVISSVVYNTV